MSGDMIAIFHMDEGTNRQTGIGIYGPARKREAGEGTNICLITDENGDGAIQFAGKGETICLTFDMVKKLVEQAGG